MKRTLNLRRACYALTATIITLTSCQKDVSTSINPETTDAIAVASSTTAADGDSVYLTNGCSKREKKDSIAQSALPPDATNYLSSNYAGYTFNKAFAVKSSEGTITGYITVIFYNDKPVGLKFDASGNFVKVLEQREKRDLNGPGWHHGGRFEDRGGSCKDTLAFNQLPASIVAYMTTNYSSDTLIKAFRNRHDSSYVILSKNNGAYATIFTANGTFINRIQLHSKQGNCQPVDEAALPGNIASYLATTYPGYVFKKAFAIKQSNSVAGYVVFIDANSTKYAAEFDASGNFVKVKTIR